MKAFDPKDGKMKDIYKQDETYYVTRDFAKDRAEMYFFFGMGLGALAVIAGVVILLAMG